MPGKEQDMLDLIPSEHDPRPVWLGLEMDNRRLFDALQDGWLRPLPSRSGSLVGVNAQFRELEETDGNRIPVRIEVNVDRLPDVEVAAFRDNRWQTMYIRQVRPTDIAVFWPGVLPILSVSDLTVISAEQRVRLLSIGKRISNIEVPNVSIASNGEGLARPIVAPPHVGAGLVVPTLEDSLRGALSMALWAVPRIDPWMDLLTASLSPDAKELSKLAGAVDATWWRFPPWAPKPDTRPEDPQERLWLAAVEVLGTTKCGRPRETADRIAEVATQGSSENDANVIATWRVATHAILRADAAIQHDGWRQHPVGLAIQLVLSRPEPTAFKTWFDDDRVSVPPAVAWSAAALCGLFHGYRGLDIRFRGKPDQREVVAIQALRLCSKGTDVNWPNVSDDPPSWKRESGNFVLAWGGREFCKREQERGKWYAADLGADAVESAAVALAAERDWPCVVRVVSFNEGIRQVAGPGMIEVDGRTVNVRGDVRISLLPNDVVKDEIDHGAFRHMIAVEPGRLKAPPTSAISDSSALSGELVEAIPGLRLIRDFLSEAEETEIIAKIDRSDWSTELQRRVQHYGWRYDYKSRQVDPSMRIGPLPDWANRLAQRLVDSGYLPVLPDQVIVNEYCRDQGISRHIDSESSFADGVAMVSLLETWEMDFRRPHGERKVSLKLERRSATVLTGEARYGWTHEIPKRKTEPGALKPGNKKRSRIRRVRRVSLTFRKMINKPVDPQIDVINDEFRVGGIAAT